MTKNVMKTTLFSINRLMLTVLLTLFVILGTFNLAALNVFAIEDGTIETFGYTGNYQEYIVPKNGTYKISLWGAQGGSSLENNKVSTVRVGGYGAYTSGLIELKAGQKLYFYVGGRGVNGKKSTIVTGGWNGGGRGDYDHSDDEAAGSGGGATDVRLSVGETGLWNDFESLQSRIMVAAGGGGTSWASPIGYGGGLSSPKTNHSVGATQTSGYAFGTGQPGVYAHKNTTVGGGGGGYYGGLAANVSGVVTNGSGGSSFISGFEGSNAISEDSEAGSITHTNQSYHYSGLYFTHGIMVRGNGVAETKDGLRSYQMPNQADGKYAAGTGNVGNGYAIIEYIEKFDNKDFPNFVYEEGYSFNYGYTGNYQTFIAPADGTYRLEAWGGRGGYGRRNSTNTYRGGFGAYTSGEIHLNKGEKFYVYVGGAGANGASVSSYAGGLGGYNGGGKGGDDKNHDSAPDSGGGGGGATDFRLVSGTWNEFNSLKSRVLIAGGGAGGTYSLVGYAGGLYLNNTNTYAFAQGQSGFAADTGSGGGGGGYFGGISNQCSGCQGYGGTSYISGSTDDLALTEDSTSTALTFTQNSIHYSGITFNNVKKINGNSTMPNYAGTGTVAGNNNNGYAKVTILSLDHGTPKLKDITVSGGTFSQKVDPDTYSYDVLVDSENTKVNIDAIPLYEESTIFKGLGELTLQAGVNTHYIGIISDTGEVSIYTLNITRPASSYKYLKDILIDGTSLPNFDPETLSYEVPLSAEQEQVELETLLGRPSQQVSGEGTIEVGFGLTVHQIEVISEDGSSVITYNIVFKKPNSSKLKSLKLENYQLVPDFDSETLEYTIDVPASVLSLDVEAIPFDNSATVSIKGNGYLKNNNVITITVNQATAGTTVYKVIVNREGAVSQTIYEYNCTKTYQEFVAPGTGYYKIELWGAQGGYGHKNYKLVNRGGFGAYTTGTIWLNKDESFFVYVGCKGANAASVSRYSGGLGGYNGGGQGGDDKNHDSAPDAAGGGGGATDIRLVSGTWNNFASLKSRLMIAAGGAGGTYYNIGFAGGLHLNKTNTYSFGLGQRGFAAYTGSGGGGGGYFGGLSPQTDGGRGFGGTSYVSGLEGMKSVDENATVNNLTLTDSNIHYSGISFTDIEAYNGDQSMPSKTSGYTVGNSGDGFARITMLPMPSENNYLASLTVKTTNYVTGITETKTYTPDFSLETLDYYLEVGVDETRATILAKPDDSTASIDGLKEYLIAAGENVIPITITAENGEIRVYNVHITRPASSNEFPTDIIISGLVPSLCSQGEGYCNVSPANFEVDTHEYYLTVPSRIKQLWFNVEKGHEFQIVSGEGKVSLNGGENVITIEIESEDGTKTSVYRYYVTRDMTGNTDLSKLEIIDPAREINYDPDVTEYYIAVPNEYTEIKEMIIETDDPNASYIISGNENFETGMNRVNILVTAANGETKTYIINVYREKSGNTYLNNIEVKNGETNYALTPEYNKVNTGVYQATVPNDVTEVEIIATPEVETTSVIGTGLVTLKTGTNEVILTTTSEDGSVELYKLNIIREKNSNTNLTSLIVKNGETIYALTPEYSNDVLDYNVDVTEGITTIEIVATPEIETTKYKLLDNNRIKVGINKKRVMVIAEDGTTKTITITINRPASSNNYLSDIKVSSGTLVPEFDRETPEYTMMVENEVSSITISGIKESILSSVSGNGKYSLAVGENVITLVVTAENGDARTYNITITRKPNSNAYLKVITTSEGILVPEFDKEKYSYTINVENTVDSISVDSTPEVSTTTVTGNRMYALVSGSNKITLTTLAEDGKTTKEYVIDVIKDKSDNDNIETLIMKEGIISPKFDSNIISYTASVPNEVTTVNFIVVLEDEAATYEIIDNENLIVGANEVIVRVTSESGLTKDYKITVTRQEVEANSNYLSNLVINKGTLTPTFAKEIEFYEVVVPYEVTQVIVTGTKEDEAASLVGNGTYKLNVGKNIIGLEVTSIDGKVRDYQILVTREKNNEARLSTLSINNGILNPNFNRDTYEYTLSTTENALTFLKVQTVDSNATYKITGNENFILGDNTVTITVTAQDGITTKDYILHVTKTPSNNNNLSDLRVEGYTISPVFNKATTLYTLAVPNDINSVTIIATPEDIASTIVGDGSQTLEVGENQLVVEVTSASGKVKAYTIIVNKEGSSNNLIRDLIVNNGVMTPEFVSTTKEYDVTTNYEEESLDLTVILEDETASYQIVDNNLSVGNNIVKVIVTAANGDVTTYNLNVTRSEIVSALLKDLSVKNYEFTQEFNPYVTTYDVTIDNEVTSLDINAIPLDKNATVNITGNENFIIGLNIVTIEVTSSDNVTKEIYTINVNRQDYANNFLDYLYTSVGDVTPIFDKFTLNYSITVPAHVDKIEIFAEPVDKSAIVTGVEEHTLVKGENIIPITVTTTSGVKRTYYVTVNRAKSDANYLETLVVKNGTTIYNLTPEFDKLTNNYELSVPSEIQNLVLLGTISDNATVSGLGTKKLTSGLNTILIEVTSESGIANVYTLIVNRELSSNNYLTGLIPSVGELEPEFNYTKTAYTINLDSSAALLSFEYSLEDPAATIEGVDSRVIPDGTSTREIVVTAEDGSVRTYTITVNKERTDNAKLSNLYINGYTFVETFDPDVYEYHVTVPNTKKILLTSEVFATPQDKNAKVTKTSNLTLSTVGDNVYVITVTAPDGFTTQQYRIIITREKSTTSSLISLKVTEGFLETNFNPNVFEYSWKIPKEIDIVLDDYVIATADSSSTITMTEQIDMHSTLEKVFIIRVTSEDGSNFVEYKLNVSYDLSNDATLKELVIDKGYYIPEFKSEQKEYDAYVYEDETIVNISATPTSETSTIVSGIGEVNLIEEVTINEIVVSAEDGTTEVYTVRIHKTVKKDEGLKNLGLNGLEGLECNQDKCELTPEFVSTVIEYSIKVPYEYEDLDVLIERMNEEQSTKVKVNGEYIEKYKLPVGKTEVVVEVYDGLKKKTREYKMIVERCKSSNTYLKSLEVLEYGLDPDFEKYKQEYTIYVGKEVEEVEVKAEAEFAGAMVQINGYNYLQEGENIVTILVTAADGSTREYIIHVIKEPEYNSYLKNITVSTGIFWELSPKFKSTTYNYTTTIDSIYDKATVEAVPVSSDTIVTGTGEYKLVTGVNKVTLVATSAGDGSVSIYTITIIKETSKNVDLLSLIVEEGDLNPSFDKGITKYEVSVGEEVEKLTIHAIPEDKRSNVIITGNENLVTGVNKVNVIVISEDKSITKTYQLTVTKAPSTNSKLSSLQVLNKELEELEYTPEFDPLNLSYTMEVSEEVEKVIIKAETESLMATIEGTGEEYLDYGMNQKQVVVTAEDGSVNVYIIEIKRKYNLKLKDLTVNEGTLEPEFDSNTYAYTLDLANDIKNITIIGEAESTKTEVIGNGEYPLVTGENEISIIVKAPDGEEAIYKLKVNRAKSDNNYIEELVVHQGIITPEFDKLVTDYTVDVRKNVTSLGMDIILEDEAADYEVIGNANFSQAKNPNQVIIRVTSESGKVRDYNLNVNLQNDEFFSNRLLDLTVSEGKLTPDFNPDINYYAVTVPNSISVVEINAVKEDEAATLKGAGIKNLSYGRNIVQLEVISKDGISNVYTVVIYREENADATLKSLSVEGYNITPIFNKHTTEYNMDVESNVTSLKVLAEPTDPASEVEISGNNYLVLGENIIRIKVTAPDKVTTMEYIIKVMKIPSSNNYISSLSVTDYNFQIEYNKLNQGPYIINVDSKVNSINVKATPEVETTEITGDGVHNITSGKNIIRVNATAEDGSTRTYTIIVNKNLSTDNSLKLLVISDGELTPEFDPDILEYTVNVPDILDKITVIGFANDSKAKVTGNGDYDLVKATTEITLTVTAEDGSTRTYKITVNKETEASSKIMDLIVHEGRLLPDFSSETLSYTVKVPNEVTSLTMDVILEDEEADYEIVGNENFGLGSNEVKVIVTATNGEKREYKIEVIRQNIASTYLKSLSIEKYPLTPTFQKENQFYELVVPKDVEKVNVEGIAEDATAKVTGNGEYPLKYGKNKVYVTVESISGVVRTYTVIITRSMEEGNYLLSLETDIGTLTPEFNPLINKYTITVPEKTKEITLSGTTSPNTTVVGLGKTEVHVGREIRTITVTSQSGLVNIYEVEIVRPASTNTELESLEPSVGELEYSNDIYEYTINLNDNVSVISFEAVPVDEDATVTGNDLKVLEYGDNQVIIEVTAEDGITKRVIKINIIRLKEIEEIKVSEENIIIEREEIRTITYEIIPSDTAYKNVKFISEDENIATVDQEGNITGVDYGTTKVKVISEHDPSIYATIIVNVISKKIESDVYEINREEMYTIGSEELTSINDYIKNFKNNPSTLFIYDELGNRIDDINQYVGTFMTIKLIIDNIEYDTLTIIVRGDLTGDGEITGPDYVRFKNYMLGKVEFNKIEEKTVDLTKDDEITGPDYVKMKNYMLGKIDKLN